MESVDIIINVFCLHLKSCVLRLKIDRTLFQQMLRYGVNYILYLSLLCKLTKLLLNISFIDMQ